MSNDPKDDPKEGKNDPKGGGNVPKESENDPKDDPKEGENVPKESGNVPKEGENDPKVGENVPKVGENVPKDGKNVPKESGNVPKDDLKGCENVSKDVPKEIWNKLTDRQKKILLLIQENSAISRTAMSLKMSVTSKTIARDIEGIRKHLRLEFVGGKTTGHWEIIIS